MKTVKKQKKQSVDILKVSELAWNDAIEKAALEVERCVPEHQEGGRVCRCPERIRALKVSL